MLIFLIISCVIGYCGWPRWALVANIVFSWIGLAELAMSPWRFPSPGEVLMGYFVVLLGTVALHIPAYWIGVKLKERAMRKGQRLHP